MLTEFSYLTVIMFMFIIIELYYIMLKKIY